MIGECGQKWQLKVFKNFSIIFQDENLRFAFFSPQEWSKHDPNSIVCFIDWSELSLLRYDFAALCVVNEDGRLIYTFINALFQEVGGRFVQRIKVNGFSLGAHIMSSVCKTLFLNHGIMIEPDSCLVKMTRKENALHLIQNIQRIL